MNSLIKVLDLMYLHMLHKLDNFHIGKIINRTTINEGIDVDITGLEAELLVVPPEVPGLSFNASISLTNSSIADGEKALDVVNRDLTINWRWSRVAPYER